MATGGGGVTVISVTLKCRDKRVIVELTEGSLQENTDHDYHCLWVVIVIVTWM